MFTLGCFCKDLDSYFNAWTAGKWEHLFLRCLYNVTTSLHTTLCERSPLKSWLDPWLWSNVCGRSITLYHLCVLCHFMPCFDWTGRRCGSQQQQRTLTFGLMTEDFTTFLPRLSTFVRVAHCKGDFTRPTSGQRLLLHFTRKQSELWLGMLTLQSNIWLDFIDLSTLFSKS